MKVHSYLVLHSDDDDVGQIVNFPESVLTVARAAIKIKRELRLSVTESNKKEKKKKTEARARKKGRKNNGNIGGNLHNQFTSRKYRIKREKKLRERNRIYEPKKE